MQKLELYHKKCCTRERSGQIKIFNAFVLIGMEIPFHSTGIGQTEFSGIRRVLDHAATLPAGKGKGITMPFPAG
jgi:hypothetical protein